MLEDFVDDLRKTLNQRLDNARAVLDGDVDPDKPRGMIAAFKDALGDLDELVERYRAPEEVPEQLASIEASDTFTGKKRRFYGRAA